MSKSSFASKNERNRSRSDAEKRRAIQKLGKKQAAQLQALVSSDATTRRRTSRKAVPRVKAYLRPMSAPDVAKLKNMPVSLVRQALGPRADVVRRYRQCMAQRRKRLSILEFQKNGCF